MIINCNMMGDDDETRTLMMKSMRNAKLAESDWTQMPDSPLTDEQRQAWATYRQALRDFPATWVPAETAEFPEAPQ